MQIDWFTLVAQIINFIIIVFLLKHFLYKRITGIMDEREKRISSRLEEAEQKKKEAQKEAESYHQKLNEIKDSREQLLSQAKEDADTKRKELIEETRREVEENRSKWFETIRQQKDAFLSELRKRTGEEIYSITRRALKDLANDELEARIIDSFIERIQQMKGDEQEVIKEFVRELNREIEVCSSFEIPQTVRQRIAAVIRDKTGKSINVRFDVSPDLICGIELNTGGRKITWSLNSYLNTLEEHISEALNQKTGKYGPSENDSLRSTEEHIKQKE